MEKFCFKKKKDEKGNNENANVAKAADTKSEEEFIMVHTTEFKKGKNCKLNNNTWLGDTGATTHMRYSLEGMKDLKSCEVKITLGSGKKIVGTKWGTWCGTILRTDGTTDPITLKDVVYCPELSFNLFSLTKGMVNGGKLGSDGTMISMTKGNQTVVFDRQRLHTVICLQLKWLPSPIRNM